MRYSEFERIMSAARMSRYVIACGGNTKKAMTLYRLNLRLSQELFTVISCFEVAFRNIIDSHYARQLGPDWLRDAILPSGMFDTFTCRRTANVIRVGNSRIGAHYTHAKLVGRNGFRPVAVLVCPAAVSSRWANTAAHLPRPT